MSKVRKILPVIMAVILLCSLLPVAAAAADTDHSGAITENQTWSDGDTVGNSSGVTITGSSSAATPLVITVLGTVHVYNTITVSSGYVTFTGGGTLLREYDGTSAALGGYLLNVKYSTTPYPIVTLNNVTLDGNGKQYSNSLLYIYQRCTVYMEGTSCIQNNTRATDAPYATGTAVQVNATGTFYMDGGIIQNCTPSYNNANNDYSGVIYVAGKIYLRGGTITSAFYPLEYSSSTNCLITPQANISITNTSGGTIQRTALSGLTIKPVDGYAISSVKANGTELPDSTLNAATGVYTLNSPYAFKNISSLNITVLPKPVGNSDTYIGSNATVNYSAGFGGTVTESNGSFTVTAANPASYTYQNNYSYTIYHVYVDGQPLGASDVTNLTQPSGSSNTGLQGAQSCTYAFAGGTTGTHSIVATFAYSAAANDSSTVPAGNTGNYTYTDENSGTLCNVNFSADSGGSISQSNGAFSVSAFNQDSYYYVIDQVYVDGQPVTAADVSNLTQPSGSANTALQGAQSCTYAFASGTTGNHSIVATFVGTLNFAQPANGTLAIQRVYTPLATGAIVRGGDILTVTETPNTNYFPKTLTVTGLTQNQDGTYTVTAGLKDITPTVSATFSGILVTFDDEWANFSTGGTALNSTSAIPLNSGSLTLTATPINGYTLAGVVATNGALVPNGDGTYTLSGVTESSKVSATAQPIDYSAQTADLTISDKQGLLDFASAVNSGNDFSGKLVKLGTDVDMGGADWTAIGQPTATEGAPHPFRGVFDGGGYTVSGLNLVRGQYNWSCVPQGDGYSSSDDYLMGLFGCINGAVIKDVTVRGQANISDTYQSNADGATYLTVAGGIAAEDMGGSTLLNCSSFVPMALTDTNASGILGGGTGTTSVIGCMNYGSLTESPYAYHVLGGDNSYFDAFDGNLCGITNRASRVYNCGNTGDLKLSTTSPQSANGEAAGILGDCGAIPVHVEGCFNTGNVDGGAASPVGGIVDICSSGLIENCYNTGKITTSADSSHIFATIGGILSYNKGMRGTGGVADGEVQITNCYNAGTIDANSSTGGNTYAGQIVPPQCFYPSAATGYAGSTTYGGTMTNCYASTDTFTASKLGAAYQNDINSINGGYPLLQYQANTVPDTTYNVTFAATPSTATVHVYQDAAMKNELTATNGVYALKNGTYYYTLSENGYVSANGSFKVAYFDKTVTVGMRTAAKVTFTVTPSDASVTVTDSTGSTVFPDSSANGVLVYTLNKGDHYTYSVTKSGYNGTTREITAADGSNIAVTLTSSSQSGTNMNIQGGQTISAGGVYNLVNISGQPSQGVITISTSQPVTLVGTGASLSDAYENLYINCAVSGVNLTIQNLYISNTLGSANMINFVGAGNSLSFAGTSILDMNTGATGYAMIHVNQNTELTVGGVTPNDTLYFYKREQGAGIGGNGGATGGGQTPEYNGKITITGGNFFMKNSKQGALIGSGAIASSAPGQPGAISIQGGVLNLIAESRGAAIGGSAGSSGGAVGTDVYISKNACVSINVDFSGSAIGGGGFALGNDSDGGTLHYSGGSIRTFIDENAAESRLWSGVSKAGVNDVALTATKIDAATGKNIYLCAVDTSRLSSNASMFTVMDGTNTLYTGGLHAWRYINESKFKTDQVEENYTIDNWYPASDSNLYLYLTGADHTLTVNGTSVKAVWDNTSKTFTLQYPSALNTDTTASSSTIDVKATISGSTSTASVNAGDVTQAISDAIANAAKNNTKPTIAINVDAPAASTKVIAQLPATSFAEVAKSTVQGLTVSTPIGFVTLDGTALDTVASQAKGSDVTLSVSTVDKTALTAAQQKSVGDGTVIDLSLTSGGTAIHDFSGGSATVSLPYTLKSGETADGIVIWYLADDGTLTPIQNASYDATTGKVTFTTPHFSNFVIGYDPAAAWKNPFTDVAKTDWFYADTQYVVTKGLFKGTSDTAFSPDGAMTRAMFVTVLGRLADIKTSDYADDSFSDVAAGQWYSAYVEWAVKNGIVTGVGDNKFDPDGQITREEIAVILYRYETFTKTDVSASKDLSVFTDASSVSSWAANALKWAAAKGLVNGMGDGTLAPQGTATRGQVAAIIHRLAIL